jgi:hypothetical protein
MKNRIFLCVAVVTAITAYTGVSSAEAETLSGKVAAITKGSKSTTVEIIPSSAGSGYPYRYSVSTTFQEIVDMLLTAMETKKSVTIVSSGTCSFDGMLRDCGSIVSVEAAKTL